MTLGEKLTLILRDVVPMLSVMVLTIFGMIGGIFTPSEAAIAEAREILAAMEQAKADGQGATVYKGRLVDIASIKQAEVIVKQAELIANR